MVPPSEVGRSRALRAPWLAAGPRVGRVTLRHALIVGDPWLAVDDADWPACVVLLRPGDGRAEAFAAGRPGPGVAWLAARALPTALLAPPDWRWALTKAVGPLATATIAVRSLPDGAEPPPAPAAPHCRPLTPADADAFAAIAPPWALRSWPGGLAGLVDRGGLAYGLPHQGGLASAAWTVATDGKFATIGVATIPSLRRLGLARACALSLFSHLRARPLWAADPANAPSLALASSLGLGVEGEETVWRWGRD